MCIPNPSRSWKIQIKFWIWQSKRCLYHHFWILKADLPNHNYFIKFYCQINSSMFVYHKSQKGYTWVIHKQVFSSTFDKNSSLLWHKYVFCITYTMISWLTILFLLSNIFIIEHIIMFDGWVSYDLNLVCLTVCNEIVTYIFAIVQEVILVDTYTCSTFFTCND